LSRVLKVESDAVKSTDREGVIVVRQVDVERSGVTSLEVHAIDSVHIALKHNLSSGMQVDVVILGLKAETADQNGQKECDLFHSFISFKV
jgi:hypothetical protein